MLRFGVGWERGGGGGGGEDDVEKFGRLGVPPEKILTMHLLKPETEQQES